MELAQPALITATVTCGGFAALGAWHARRARVDAEAFHTARNAVGTLWSATSLVALVAGTWVLFSPGEMASYTGLATLVGYALGQAAPLLILALLGPALRQRYPDAPSPGLMARARWGASGHALVSGLSLAYMGVYVAAELTAIAFAFHVVAGVSPALTASLVAGATLLYAAWGGLRTTIFTDGVQAWFIVPLLIAAFLGSVAAFGGWEAAQRPLADSPLMQFANRAGIEAGLMLVVAIIAANLFDQSLWQRVFACRDAATVRRSFLLAGAGIVPVILLAGWFGLWYAGLGMPAEGAPGALFAVVASHTPMWVVLAFLALALALVMSTLGSLLNAIASTVAHDAGSVFPRLGTDGRLRLGRIVSIAAAIPAVLIAARLPSVTYVFLIADLLCAAAVVPVFLGLCGAPLRRSGLFAATILGLAVGGATFTGTDLMTPFVDARPWLLLPADANALLVSFAAAVLASALVAAAWLPFGRTKG